MKHIISLSGGKDSTAMLLRMHELKMPIDEVIFADNGWEFPEMVNSVIALEKALPYKFTRIDLKKRFHYLFYDHIVTKGKHKGKQSGFPSAKMRWCTREKGRAIDRHLKQHGSTTQYIGFAYEEKYRAARSEIKRTIKMIRFPLIEWGWTEKQCLDYCYNRGFRFGGFYEKFKRGGCWCCPLQPRKSLRSLYKHYPGLWKKLKKMQEHSHIPFRMDGKTVFDLDERFRQEDRQTELTF